MTDEYVPDPVAEAEANLAMVKLERRLVELKEDGDPEELRACKHELREARRVYREMRRPIVSDGDAIATPEVIASSMTVQKGSD